MIYRDRRHGGISLAKRLEEYRNENPIVLGVPRGGVPVAYEVARELEAPLDLAYARKLGAPGQPEFGFGAIAPGAVYLDPESVALLGLSKEDIDAVAAVEERELNRRLRQYHNARRPPVLEGRTVILVDDGLATGVTAKASILSLRKQNPRKIIFASPVCASDSAAALGEMADAVVCNALPENFAAVGQWYVDFGQTTDQEVMDILSKAAREYETINAPISPSKQMGTQDGEEGRP
jgi:predicted phosphoribosyltransferase